MRTVKAPVIPRHLTTYQKAGTPHDISIPLRPRQLRQRVKVHIAGAQNKRMLQDEGRDPHVVGRYGSALLAQLPVNSAVMMRGLLIGVEHTDAGLQQKTAQHGLVARSLTAYGKSGAQFSQHDEGQPDFIGEFDGFDN